LLEQFLESGFDKNTTLNLINSILSLKTVDDNFATIDLSIINLYTAEVEFLKIGAVPTFIKRKNVIEQINSFTLPAGILNNLEIELLKQDLSDGDLIIMISDGVLDSYRSSIDEKQSYEKQLIDYINSLYSTNPQEIADSIINMACKNCNDIPPDDMLVMVSKIWKRL
jgi:stage II sporulation protein E